MINVDFSAVQWARKLMVDIEPLLGRSGEDWLKLNQLVSQLTRLKDVGVTPTSAQLTVILQQLHTKQLDKLEAVKGGIMVELGGGGFEYERFLLRVDGRVPNHKYESKRVE